MTRDNVPRTVALLEHIEKLSNLISQLPRRADGGKTKYERDLDRLLLHWHRVPRQIRKATEIAIKLGMVHAAR